MRALNIPGHAGRPQPRRLLELISGDFLTEKAEEVTKGHCWTSNKAALMGVWRLAAACWLCRGKEQDWEGRNQAEGRITERANTGLPRDFFGQKP